MAPPPCPTLDPALLTAWLAEDVGAGDVTTEATVPAGVIAEAEILVKQPAVVCGLGLVGQVLRRLDPHALVEELLPDATWVEERAVAARIRGNARAVLTGERLALNLLGRVCGIATTTRSYVQAVEGTGVQVLDTRKTAPGLRALDRYAVACGGGTNHRFGLFDAVLIKDNHLDLAGGPEEAVRRAREHAPGLPVEVEARTLDEVDAAVRAGADTILLDNMAPDLLREAVAHVGGRARTEASGGVTLETLRAIAETGVDAISVGALTHSVTVADISLEIRRFV